MTPKIHVLLCAVHVSAIVVLWMFTLWCHATYYNDDIIQMKTVTSQCHCSWHRSNASLRHHRLYSVTLCHCSIQILYSILRVLEYFFQNTPYPDTLPNPSQLEYSFYEWLRKVNLENRVQYLISHCKYSWNLARSLFPTHSDTSRYHLGVSLYIQRKGNTN